jgi:hypothetical protein
VGSCWLRTVNLPEASSLRHSVQARSIVTNGQTMPRRAHCSRVQIRLRLQRSEVRLSVFAGASVRDDIRCHTLTASYFMSVLWIGNRYSKLRRSCSLIRISPPNFRAGNRPLSICRLTVRTETCQRAATSLMLNQGVGMTGSTDFIIIPFCKFQATSKLKQRRLDLRLLCVTTLTCDNTGKAFTDCDTCSLWPESQAVSVAVVRHGVGAGEHGKVWEMIRPP